MTRDEVLAKLRAHEAELRGAGIAALWLFGSVARGEAREDSDVDLFFERGQGVRLSLFDLMDLRDRVVAMLGSPVDLGERTGFRPRVRARIEPDALRVF